MLAARLSKLLGENTTGEPGDGLFRFSRTVFNPGAEDGEGLLEGAYERVGQTTTSQLEPLMTAQESLCAFELVEMLVTIQARCRGVFTASSTRTRYLQMDKSQLGLRRGWR